MSVSTLLDSIVRLRLAIAQTRDPALRGELREIEATLRGELAPFVAKRKAARLLGVSVTALDRWIDRGRIPVVAREGSSRLAVETGPLLELAVETTRLRREGTKRGRLAGALERLGRRDSPDGRQVLRADVAALPRPNVSAAELRHDYETTSPEERVAQLAALNRSMNTVLAGARE